MLAPRGTKIVKRGLPANGESQESGVVSLKGEKPGQEEKLTMEVSGGEPYMLNNQYSVYEFS